MDLQKIEYLIKKFESGETTLEEENELKVFFAGNIVPDHLKVYKQMFGFYSNAVHEEVPDKDFDEKVLQKIEQMNSKATGHRKIRRLYSWIGVAASIVVLIGLYFYFQNQNIHTGTYEDPELAYAHTKKILLAVSENLNQGTEELSNIGEFNKGIREMYNIGSFKDGMNSLEKISILDKSKKIVTQ
jgi:hypothetical protein